MANIKFTNFARSTLAIGAASGATSMTVASGTGVKFPTLGAGEYFYATLENAGLVREIVKVTARTTDVMTVVRAQDNTTAQTWNAGDVFSLRFNAAAITEAVVGTLLSANNLSDLADTTTARTNLGAAVAGPIGSSGITGAAASGANTDITSVATTTTINGTVIGYREVPQNTQSGSYTPALTDAGKHIYGTNAGAQTITLPTNATVAFPVGTAITIINNGTTAITFTTTGTTVYKAGTSAAWASGGTLAVRGMVSVLKVATDTWFISGAGLS